MRRKLKGLLTIPIPFLVRFPESVNFSPFGWIPIHLATIATTSSNKIAAVPFFPHSRSVFEHLLGTRHSVLDSDHPDRQGRDLMKITV